MALLLLPAPAGRMKKKNKKKKPEDMNPAELAALIEKKAARLHHLILLQNATREGVHPNKKKYTRKKKHPKSDK